MTSKDDRYYAAILLREVDRLIDFSKRVDFSDPERNVEAIYAMNFCIVQIRENLDSLSQDFKRAKLGFRLDQFTNFRNLLVHEYGKTDYTAYRDFIESDIPAFRKTLAAFLG